MMLKADVNNCKQIFQSVGEQDIQSGEGSPSRWQKTITRNLASTPNFPFMQFISNCHTGSLLEFYCVPPQCVH